MITGRPYVGLKCELSGEVVPALLLCRPVSSSKHYALAKRARILCEGVDLWVECDELVGLPEGVIPQPVVVADVGAPLTVGVV